MLLLLLVVVVVVVVVLLLLVVVVVSFRFRMNLSRRIGESTTCAGIRSVLMSSITECQGEGLESQSACSS